MPERSQDNDKPENKNRRCKRPWTIALAVVAAVAAVWLVIRFVLPQGQTADQRLAEIEAARAIPDSENAAVVYNQLLEDPSTAVPIDPRPKFLDNESFYQNLWEPWLSKDYPELAAWVEEHQDTIARLFEACEFQECRFLIFIDTEHMLQQSQRLKAIREWAHLLRFAANNDIAEGRTDDAIAKWRCLVRMGEHLRQQPSHLEDLIAIAIDTMALQQSAIYIVEGDAVEMRLRQIESIRFDTKDNWAARVEQIRLIEDLVMQKLKEEFGPIDYINYLLNYGIYAMLKHPTPDRLHIIHLRHIASRRGNHILIALRRCKNNHGHWPQSLDEIKPHVLAEALVDPYNDGPFVYRLTENGFELYSKGKNNLDENGKFRDPFDDWPIWPPTTRRPKPEPKNAKTKQPDPNKPPTE